MDIKLIKKRLNELGYGPLDEKNPNYGEITKENVRLFQKDAGIKADGLVGPQTLQKLFEYEIHPSSKPEIKSIPNEHKGLAIQAMNVAISQNGVREKTGKNDGPEVEAYLASVGLGPGYSWCMAFVYWCYRQASSSLGVVNPLVRTGGVLKQWNETNGLNKFTFPKQADIFIIDLGSGNGHTGIVTNVQGDKISTIEGNTNDNGSSNGDGVYLRSRKISQIKGYIRY